MGKFDSFDGLSLKEKEERPRIDISKNNKKIRMTFYANDRTKKEIQEIVEKLKPKTKQDIYNIVIEDYAKSHGCNLTEDAVYLDMPADEPKGYASFSLDPTKRKKLDEITKYMNIQNRTLTVEWLIENYRKDYDQ